MEANLDELARELAALTQRFIDLGAKLGDAARALEDGGAPPADGLVEALGGARTDFIQLRTDILAAATAASAPPTAPPESLNDLEPVLGAVGEARRRQARRAMLQQARTVALATLDRVLELIHHDDPRFAALTACHDKGRQIRAAVLALPDADTAQTERVLGSLQSFADLLTMLANRQALDDARYAHLEESVSRAFGRGLAVAVARGRVGFIGDVVEPPVAAAPAPVSAPANVPHVPVAAGPPRLEAPPEPPIVQTLHIPKSEQAAPPPEPVLASAEAPPLPPPVPTIELPTPGPVPMLEVPRPTLEIAKPEPVPVETPRLEPTAAAPELAPPRLEPPPEPPIVQTLHIPKSEQTGPPPEPVIARAETPPAPSTPAPPRAEPPPPAPSIPPSATPKPRRPAAPEPAPATIHAAAPEAADPSGSDETAQWWLSAWARWSGWKATQRFNDAAKEEIGKYPYLLSVPIQRSAEYEEGLVAYGYSILVDHVDKQNPGCVGNALNSLTPGQARPLGDQLYDYVIREGRLSETYAEFVKNALLAALPEPGVWFQFRILESKEDTRIFQRPSGRIGDTELSGQRLASDTQRYAEHKFRMTVLPLTTRFVVVSAEMIRDARGVGVKLASDGTPSDSGWIVAVPARASRSAKVEARRVSAEGTHVPGLGKDHAAVWIAVLNPDPASERRYELSVFLRKDTRSPFRGKS